jgi:hypothetical protein
MSNSHNYFIHNILNSCRLFTLVALITSMIYHTLVRITPFYIEKSHIFIIHFSYFMSISIIYNLSHKFPSLLYLQDMLKSFFFSVKLCR